MSLLHAVDEPAPRGFKSDLSHRILEQLPVFGLLDRVELRPDQLDAVFLQHTALREGDSGIQRRLSAHRRKNGIRPLFFNDFFDHSRGNRLDIRRIGELRVGHDRGRIAVDQNDTVAFFPQDFAGLSAGVIKFTCLTNNDRAGTDDEDGFDVGTLGQLLLSLVEHGEDKLSGN